MDDVSGAEDVGGGRGVAAAAALPPPPDGLDALYERLGAAADEFPVAFEPMLPRVYEIMLPSLDARLNFVNVGRRHAAFLRYVYGERVDCEHAHIVREKTKLLTAILTKLLDVNGILERR
ncbi:T51 [Tupaiid betaherpesvirus 1]|uniref:T51 n=1 Tax=Tupaiid herpesvirus 1 (strain 1) TaxID=10397 RepID=Q91TN7_TUHV1|nr:T51 [Tupaiid betaherpesvirus 1]AAK57100.1 T51 [Tupaiid betaherpesvirus 1]